MSHPAVADGRPVGARAVTPGGPWVCGASLGVKTIVGGRATQQTRLFSPLVMPRPPRDRRESLRALPLAPTTTAGWIIISTSMVNNHYF